MTSRHEGDVVIRHNLLKDDVADLCCCAHLSVGMEKSVRKQVIADNSVAFWLKLVMVPKCILPSCKHSCHYNKPVPIAFLWMQDQFSDLWNMASSWATSKQHCTKDISREQLLIYISYLPCPRWKVCHTLVSPGLAPIMK